MDDTVVHTPSRYRSIAHNAVPTASQDFMDTRYLATTINVLNPSIENLPYPVAEPPPKKQNGMHMKTNALHETEKLHRTYTPRSNSQIIRDPQSNFSKNNNSNRPTQTSNNRRSSWVTQETTTHEDLLDEIPLHQLQAQRVKQRRLQQSHQGINKAGESAAKLAAGKPTSRDVRIAPNKVHKSYISDRKPSGTGHRLRPAERPTAGMSTTQLNPAWRPHVKVSQPGLSNSHLAFTAHVRDDDPVSGISGVGRPCVVRLGTDGVLCRGTIAFRGETQFKHGTWVGIALQKPLGKHDGVVQGIRYFQCTPGHGVFVREHAVQIGKDPDLLPGPPLRLLARTPARRTPKKMVENLQNSKSLYKSQAIQKKLRVSRSPSPVAQFEIDYDIDTDEDSDIGDEANELSSSNLGNNFQKNQSRVTIENLRRRNAQQIIDDVYVEHDNGQFTDHSSTHGSDDGDYSISSSNRSVSPNLDDVESLTNEPSDVYTFEQAVVLKKICGTILKHPRKSLKLFSEADHEGTGLLEVNELHKALRRLHVFLTMSDVANLCDAEGICYGGKIMFSKLLALDYQLLRNKVRQHRKIDAVHKLPNNGGSFLGLQPRNRNNKVIEQRSHRFERAKLDKRKKRRKQHQGKQKRAESMAMAKNDARNSHLRKKTNREKAAGKLHESGYVQKDEVLDSWQRAEDDAIESDANDSAMESNTFKLPNAIDFSSLTRRLAKLKNAVDEVLPSSGSDSDAHPEADRIIRHRHRRSTRRNKAHLEEETLPSRDDLSHEYIKRKEREETNSGQPIMNSVPNDRKILMMNGSPEQLNSATVAEIRMEASKLQRRNAPPHMRNQSQILRALGMSPPPEKGVIPKIDVVTTETNSLSPVKVTIAAPDWKVQHNELGEMTITSPPLKTESSRISTAQLQRRKNETGLQRFRSVSSTSFGHMHRNIPWQSTAGGEQKIHQAFHSRRSLHEPHRAVETYRRY